MTEAKPRTLADLKAGDEVAIGFRRMSGRYDYQLERVQKGTPKRIQALGYNYSRGSGRCIDRYGTTIATVDPEHLAEAQKNRAAAIAHAEARQIAEQERKALHARRQAALERVAAYVEACGPIEDGTRRTIGETYRDGWRHDLLLSDLIDVLALARHL